MKTIAIMQPTYLPWLGYFDMMDQCDTFVLLDSVQFDKRSWQQRNRIKAPDGELLLTVPVFSRGKYTQEIREVEIDQTSGFPEKHIKAFEYNYRKAPFYSTHIGQLSAILMKRHRCLAELTIELISWLKETIGIGTELIKSSLLHAEGHKAELLVSICKQLGAEGYLSPVGSRAYLEGDNIFAENGIELRYHEYQHPRYRQLYGDFISHLSVLDLLMNEGGQTLSIIRSGRVMVH